MVEGDWAEGIGTVGEQRGAANRAGVFCSATCLVSDYFTPGKEKGIVLPCAP